LYPSELTMEYVRGELNIVRKAGSTSWSACAILLIEVSRQLAILSELLTRVNFECIEEWLKGLSNGVVSGCIDYFPKPNRRWRVVEQPFRSGTVEYK
jgi:hypothetical protein